MEQMKDSGVNWIGAIPHYWSVQPIKYLTQKIGSGKTPSGGAETYTDTGVIFLRSQNIYNTGLELSDVSHISEQTDLEMQNSRVRYNDVLLNMTGGSIGRCCIYTHENTSANVNQHVCIIRADADKIRPQFLRYFWNSSAGSKVIDQYQTGANRPGLNFEQIGNMRIPVCNIETQDRIIQYLDDKYAAIDEIITEAKASIEDYKLWRESLIAYMVEHGIPSDTPMQKTGVSWAKEIPAHWKVVPAKALFKQSNQRALPRDEQLTASQKYGIITQADYMVRENAKVVAATTGLENWKHVEPNNFIISLRSFQGGLEISHVTGCITWHYIVLVPNEDVYPNYYKWLFKSAKYINALQSTCNFIRDGQDLRFSNFVQVPLFVVPIEEQKEISAYLDEKTSKIDELISEKQALISDLEAYKKSLHV